MVGLYVEHLLFILFFKLVFIQILPVNKSLICISITLWRQEEHLSPKIICL